MLSMNAIARPTPARVKRAAKAGAIKSLGHAAAALRLVARHSIRKSRQPAEAGTPPNTREGRLRSAIRYAVEKPQQTAVIGPAHEVVADAGKAHEFGGRYRKERYRKRPFMGPALAKVAPRLPEKFKGSEGVR